MKLHEKIQALRKQHNMSQEQLGAIMGVSRQAISKWELGESIPDVDNIVHLSEVFNVTTDFLLKNARHLPPEHETEEHIPLPETFIAPRQNYIFTRTLLIAGGIGLIMSSIGGLLWWRTADMLFAASLYVIVLGIAAIIRKYLHNTQVPTLAVVGAKIILGCFIVISISGIQGFLNRDRANILLVFTWAVAQIGNMLIFAACTKQFFDKRKKTTNVIDLRPNATESDVTSWKN